MRNIKALGVAFIAILALSSVTAAAVSADDLTAEKYPVTLTGTNDGEFVDQITTTFGTLKCTKSTYTATVNGPTTSITATANFADGTCGASGIPMIIDMNGCTYKFNIGAGTTGDVDLVCPAGSEVTVTVTPASGTSPCTGHIKPQSDILGLATYSNIGAGSTREITVNAELTGLDYSHTAGTGLAKCTAGSATNGTLKAKVILTGENDGGGFVEHIGLFMS